MGTGAAAPPRTTWCPADTVEQVQARTPPLRPLHTTPKPCGGPSPGTHACCPCAFNTLRPRHAAAQVDVLTFAAPAPRARRARGTFSHRPCARGMLHQSHAAGQAQCTYTRRPCALTRARLSERSPAPKKSMRLRGAQQNGPPRDRDRLTRRAASAGARPFSAGSATSCSAAGEAPLPGACASVMLQ
jgi:hypothetical protein